MYLQDFNVVGCIRNKKPIDLINPSETLHMRSQIEICSDASEKNLNFTDEFLKPFLSIPIANSKWPIIGTEVLWDIMT